MLGFIRSHLQAKLILAFVLVMLIPTLVVSAYNLLRTRATLLDQISAEQLRVAEARAAAAESSIAEGGADLLFVVASPALRRFADARAGATEGVADTFRDFLQQSIGRYSGLCLLGPTGVELVCVRQGDDGRFRRVPEQNLRSRQNAPYFLGALRQAGIPDGNMVAISGVDRGDASTPLLRYSILYPNNRGVAAGVLALEAPLAPILAVLVDPTAGVRTSVLDSDGTYLYYPDLNPSDAHTLSLTEEQPHDAQIILRQPVGTIIDSPDRPASFQAFTRMRPHSQSAVQWTVIYQQSYADALAPVRETQVVIAAITILALVAATALAHMLAGGIVRPIRALAAAAERIGAGDLGATIPHAGLDEIGALARTFEHTVARLRETLNAAEGRRKEAETLWATTQALSTTLDLDRVLALILSELRKVVPFDSASVQEVQGDVSRIISTYGLVRSEGMLGAAFPLLPGATPNAEVALTRAPLILDDGPTIYPIFSSEPFRADPIRSWMGVPMIFGERLIGMITLDKYEPNFYSSEHARLAAAFAAQAAAAMENARLYEAARRELEDRRRAEEELRQAQKMEALGRLAGGMAHDFNNLLTVILGEVEIILEDLPVGHDLRLSAEQIRQSSTRASALTRQLLVFSRRQVLEPDLISLNEVIAGMEQMLRRLIGEDIALTIALAPALPQVRADQGQIVQVVMNLAINARDAMPNGGHLLIETAPLSPDEAAARHEEGVGEGAQAMIAVRDTGMGMDEQTRAHIFEPFFTTKPRGKGTGLGLATVHGIVRQSGGHIWFHSEPGQGATFKIYLPAADSSATKASSAPPRAPDRQRAAVSTVLLVEDDDDVRSLARQILARQGFTVIEAGNGPAALALALTYTRPISVLLTDVVMPGGLNGVQLAAALRSSRPTTRVVYMSGYTENALVDRSIAEEGARFLQKPFTPDDLVQMVLEALV
ncbi:MAG: response regulator [Chloroflexales bacterium]|nr:response regulator [Chloroflexales bacterium]